MESKRYDLSRAFVYADGKHLLLGIQTIWYKPSREDNVYGGISTKILYPTLRSLENKYPLSMWPKFICLPPEIMTTGSFDKLKANIEPTDVAVDRLFVECNRQTRLMASAVLKIKTEEFSWKNLFTGGEGPASRFQGPTYSLDKVGTPVLGRVTTSLIDKKCYQVIAGMPYGHVKDLPLRNGDTVPIMGIYDIEVETPTGSITPMAMVAFGKTTKFSWTDIIRRFIMKLTGSDEYNRRYNPEDMSYWLIPFDCIRIISSPEVPPPEV